MVDVRFEPTTRALPMTPFIQVIVCWATSTGKMLTNSWRNYSSKTYTKKDTALCPLVGSCRIAPTNSQSIRVLLLPLYVSKIRNLPTASFKLQDQRHS